MNSSRRRAFAWLLLSGLCLFVPHSAHAVVLADSNLGFSNLQIVPRDAAGNPIGTVVLSPWSLEAFAEARNSLGELDQDFDSGTSPDQVQADAAVTWASGHGDANSIVNIPDHIKLQWAASQGRGSLSNLFTITGETGSVDVNFSVDIAGFLHVLTTNNGVLAETETIFTLQVIDLSLLPPDNIALLLSDYQHLLVGPNAELSRSVSRTLATTLTLAFDIPYFLYIEVDSESYGVVPEPPVLALMSFGVGMLVVSARKNRRIIRAS